MDIKYLDREFLAKLDQVVPIMQAHEVIDPLHKGSGQENYVYSDPKFGDVNLSVLHRDDGVFIVSAENGKQAASPCLATAVREII